MRPLAMRCYLAMALLIWANGLNAQDSALSATAPIELAKMQMFIGNQQLDLAKQIANQYSAARASDTILGCGAAEELLLYAASARKIAESTRTEALSAPKAFAPASATHSLDLAQLRVHAERCGGRLFARSLDAQTDQLRSAGQFIPAYRAAKAGLLQWAKTAPKGVEHAQALNEVSAVAVRLAKAREGIIYAKAALRLSLKINGKKRHLSATCTIKFSVLVLD